MMMMIMMMMMMIMMMMSLLLAPYLSVLHQSGLHHDEVEIAGPMHHRPGGSKGATWGFQEPIAEAHTGTALAQP